MKIYHKEDLVIWLLKGAFADMVSIFPNKKVYIDETVYEIDSGKKPVYHYYFDPLPPQNTNKYVSATIPEQISSESFNNFLKELLVNDG